MYLRKRNLNLTLIGYFGLSMLQKVFERFADMKSNTQGMENHEKILHSALEHQNTE